MTEEKKTECCPPAKWHHNRGAGDACGGIYFFAMIGAAVYFVQQVHGFWPIVWAVLKAIAWPAFLIYKIFSMWHM